MELSVKQQEQIFAQGYGKIKMFKVASFGMTTEYIKNPNLSVSQLKKAPAFIVEATTEMKLQAKENRDREELENKTISILDYAKKLAKANKAKITHKSKSGSVYLLVGEKTVRISGHYILDRDVMNPKSRHDLQIVQNYFTENDNVNLNF